MVYGDRAESVVAGFVCVNLNIPLCHFQGGDLSGNIDEKFRHILTKMSDLLFHQIRLVNKEFYNWRKSKECV